MELGRQQSQSPYGALIITTSVMFAVIMCVVFVKPLLDSNSKYSLEKKKAMAEYDRYSKKKNILAGIKDNPETLAKFKQAEEMILKAIPRTNDQANSYAQIEGISNELNIKTSSVKEAESSGSTVATDGTTSPIHEIGLDITSKGSYDALIKTFEKLESDLRLFNVNRISIQPEDGYLSYNLSVIAYYKDEVQLEDK